MAKNVIVSLSGGMDSSTLLLRCIKEYGSVTAVSFDYGQKHVVELERAQELIKYVNSKAVREVTMDLGGYTINQFPEVTYKVIKLDGLVELLNSNLVTGGEDVPEGHYEEENMKATVVPNRNKIFSSIVQAIALSKANETGQQTDIALGIHAGDHAIYPDCRQEFRDADDNAFRVGNWEAEKVGYFTPYLEGDKFDILKDGEYLCAQLGLSFNEVYKRTNTSYKPIKHYYRPETYAFKWYSDYKSASSVERIEAFLKLGRPDPVEYADETGPVEWEVAKAHVEKLLAEHSA
jgi:7-cyano-7-deazaguanine synthase